MADRLLLYISAASDLRAEREVLGRAVTEVPVSLAWRVVHSPGGDEPVDVDAVSRADVHLLLLGGDIRAPVGLFVDAALALHWGTVMSGQTPDGRRYALLGRALLAQAEGAAA